MLYFAGRNAYRYIWLFMATVVIFADTGMSWLMRSAIPQGQEMDKYCSRF